MNEKCVQARSVSFPLALVLFCCGLGLLHLLASEKGVASADTTILCLEHLGASDKPVFPVVIAARKPTPAELQLIRAGGADLDFVNLVLLPHADLERLVKDLRGWLEPPATRAADPVDAALLATLALIKPATADRTAPVAKEKIVRRLDREAALELLRKLDRFQPRDAAAAAALKEELQDFKSRTQLNPKP